MITAVNNATSTAVKVAVTTSKRTLRHRAGVSLVELMIALAIAASLLTATAVALDASIKAYQINLQQSSLLQAGRIATNRMLSTIRRAKLHAPYTAAMSSNFATGATVTDTGIAMFDANGVQTTFRYDAATKTVLATFNGTTKTLLHGVEDFKVTLEPMRSVNSVKTGGSWDLLKRASILVTLKTASQTAMGPETDNSLKLTLSSSIMPRRNAW